MILNYEDGTTTKTNKCRCGNVIIEPQKECIVCKNRKERLALILEVSDRILEVADAANECSRGDLQGISEATAQKIISQLEQYFENKNKEARPKCLKQ